MRLCNGNRVDGRVKPGRDESVAASRRKLLLVPLAGVGGFP
jgi:hypothetical protein